MLVSAARFRANAGEELESEIIHLCAMPYNTNRYSGCAHVS